MPEMIQEDRFIYICEGELYGKCITCLLFYPFHYCFDDNKRGNEGVKEEKCYYCRRGMGQFKYLSKKN